MDTEFHTIIYAPLQLKYRVLNRWLVSEVLTRHVHFEPMTMEGDINDWLIKGFSIHENPCRKEFVEQRRLQVPELPIASVPKVGELARLWGKEAEWNVYFPWGNPRVESSGFYYVPTHMLRYAYTVINSAVAHKAALRIKTCGGVALWVNGRLAADFTPFTRNIEQSSVAEIELEAGDNEFVVLHEDLAERDTLFHFVIEYMGEEDIRIHVPLPSWEDAGQVLRTEEALERAYLPKDSFGDEEIRLTFERSFGTDLEFKINHKSFFGGTETIARKLPARRSELIVGHTDEFGTEYKYFLFHTQVGGVAIKKLFGMELYNSKYEPAGAAALTVEERKRIALECVAELGIPDIHSAIARLKTGGDSEVSRELIRQGLIGIRERRDCADFYLIAMFRFWRDYRDSGLFGDAFWNEVKMTMLGFRYWIDEPGDDVMWFFSENHALLFHSCQLLAGQLFPDELFTNSGELGAARKRKAEAMLLDWFDRFFEEGIAEWNSNAYIPIDILGLVNLYDLAELPQLREKAKQAMDLLYSYMTLEAHRGYLATTFGRSYEKELIGNRAAGTTSLLWAGYGVGNVNNTTFHVSFYLSDYVPPAAYGAHQRLGGGEELVYLLEQGKAGYAKLYHYRTDRFALGSIDNFRPGSKGYQEHIMHLSIAPQTQVWVNHPGEIYPYGSGRPCFWAGNGYLPKAGQYKGLGLLLYHIGEDHDGGYTHAYFPEYAFDRVERRGNWCFGEKDGAYAAVYAARGLQITDAGANRARELASEGRRNAWLVRAGDQESFGSFSAFVEQLSGAKVNCDLNGELAVTFADPKYGEVRFSWNGPVTVNSIPAVRSGSGAAGRIERKERSE